MKAAMEIPVETAIPGAMEIPVEMATRGKMVSWVRGAVVQTRTATSRFKDVMLQGVALVRAVALPVGAVSVLVPRHPTCRTRAE